MHAFECTSPTGEGRGGEGREEEGRGLASAESTKLVVDRCTHRFLVVCQHCVEGGAELGVGGGL